MISFKLFCESGKNFGSDYFEGLWITAKGKIEDVGFSGHAEYVREHPEEFNIPEIVVSSFHIDALVSLAVKEGGIHVFINMGQEKMCELDAYTEHSIKRQISAVLKVLSKYKVPVERTYCLLTKTETRYTLQSILRS